jgi:hypothetical protein
MPTKRDGILSSPRLQRITGDRKMKLPHDPYGSVSARGVAASAMAPGFAPLLAYYIAGKLHIILPDHWARGVFLVHAEIAYISVLPGFWLAYLARWRDYAYVIVGCIFPIPLWIIMIPFVPSDITVGPLNPQFFILPMVIFSGLASAVIFRLVLK